VKRKPSDVPGLTPEQIREALERGAKSANELLRKLNSAHLQGMSRSMSLRLD